MCKSKWKSLRDNYRREYKKLIKIKETNQFATSSWIHFNELKFLECVINRNKLSSSFDDDLLKSNDIEAIVMEATDYNNDDGSNYSYIKQQQQQLWKTKHQNLTHCCPHEAGDEYINFFKSITPYLALMDPSTKLRVRIAIQEIILSELTKKIDDTKRKMLNDCAVTLHPKKKRISKRIIKKNPKYN